MLGIGVRTCFGSCVNHEYIYVCMVYAMPLCFVSMSLSVSVGVCVKTDLEHGVLQVFAEEVAVAAGNTFAWRGARGWWWWWGDIEYEGRSIT